MPKNNKIVLGVLLSLVAVLVLAVVFSLSSKTRNAARMNVADESAEVSPTTAPLATEQAKLTTLPTGAAGTIGTKVDIDADLKSLDSIDLSGIENDYSDNNL